MRSSIALCDMLLKDAWACFLNFSGVERMRMCPALPERGE